jgi:hypothetical protein
MKGPLALKGGGGDPPFTATFLAVKLLDIGLVTMYFFVLGMISAKLFDSFIIWLNGEDYENTPLWRLSLEIIAQLIFVGILAYVLRNIVEMIPFPLNGVAGFQHSRLKELDGGEVLAIALIVFQINIYDKIVVFVNRIIGVQVKKDEIPKSSKGRRK